MDEKENFLTSFLQLFGVSPTTQQKAIEYYHQNFTLPSIDMLTQLLQTELHSEKLSYVISSYENESMKFQQPQQYNYYYQQPDAGQIGRENLLRERINKMETELRETREKNEKIEIDYLKSQISKLQDTIAQQQQPQTTVQQQQQQNNPQNNFVIDQLRADIKRLEDQSKQMTMDAQRDERQREIQRLEELRTRRPQHRLEPEIKVDTPHVEIPSVPKPVQETKPKVGWRKFCHVADTTWEWDERQNSASAYLNQLMEGGFSIDYMISYAKEHGLLPTPKPTEKSDKKDEEEDEEED